jgi:(2Fe-2S) ferredoxin
MGISLLYIGYNYNNYYKNLSEDEAKKILEKYLIGNE